MRIGFKYLLLILFCATTLRTDLAQNASAPAPQQLSNEQSTQIADSVRESERVVQLYKAGKYDEALPLAKHVWQIRQEILGMNDGRTAAAAINLAEIYMAKRNYGEAEKLYAALLPVYEKVFGMDHSNTTMIVDSLALTNYLKGDFKASESFYVRGVSMRERALGADHRDVARALLELAEFYRSRGDYEKAEPLYLRAISINDKQPTRDDPDAYYVMQRYECFLYESKGGSEGIKKANEFEESRRKDLPPHNPQSGGVLNGKAIKLVTPGYPPEAHAMRASGAVRVQVTIDETGKVIDARFVCGNPVFTQAVLDAARQSRFSPTKLSGMPVKVNGIIIYNFVRY